MVMWGSESHVREEPGTRASGLGGATAVLSRKPVA